MKIEACGDTPAQALDALFLIVMAIMVYNMQQGFAFLEAGAVSIKATMATLFKNVLDVAVGSIAFLAFGYAFAYGSTSNDFIGTRGFFLTELSSCSFPFYFFQNAFAATCTTIISGAVAGRASTMSYFVYSVVCTGWIYPVVVHWVWSEGGWLTRGYDGVGFTDFAGSGVVHITGGTCALIGAIMMKPRRNRVDLDGDFRPVRPHSVPLIVLGGFILTFGFFAFNAGSLLTLQDGTGKSLSLLGLICINTLVCACAGCVAATFIDYRFTGEVSLLTAINGLLGGAVSSCAGADAVEPWACLLIGAIGGLVVVFWTYVLPKLHIDDAVGAAPVHLGCGLWGLFAEAFFSMNQGIFYAKADISFRHFGWQLLGAVVIAAWAAVMSVLMFLPLKRTGNLRVKEEYEERGLDVSFFGGRAYNHDLATGAGPAIKTAELP
eukprot:TRINITY_DN8501_c0_g1_i3.p1 TRINITY_DN8501_c0_g1~~TRINITY_DN8501_c0_g1_i3.p1  ORF type:complete len:435 (+),score=87.45 TRINITY_DN8501_c0_g1_i3:173-1477(+)